MSLKYLSTYRQDRNLSRNLTKRSDIDNAIIITFSTRKASYFRFSCTKAVFSICLCRFTPKYVELPIFLSFATMGYNHKEDTLHPHIADPDIDRYIDYFR